MGCPAGSPFLCLGLAGFLFGGLPSDAMAPSGASFGPRRPCSIDSSSRTLVDPVSCLWQCSSCSVCTRSGSPFPCSGPPPLSRAWLEADRTFFYLLFFSLALVFLANRGARVAFRYLLLAGSLAVVILVLVRLGSTQDLTLLFQENRFVYPISYPNGAAALYLIPFWPLMWLAVDSRERAPVRGLSLGTAAALLALAFLTQSRGAIWALAITLAIMFIVSPARLRTLFYLLVPAILMVWAVPTLDRYWEQGTAGLSGWVAARTIVVLLLVVAFVGMVLALLERWVSVSRRMRIIFGTVVLLGALAAVTYGAVVLTRDVGGPFAWLSDTWQKFTSGQTAVIGSSSGDSQTPSSRFVTISASGRTDIWRVAWLDFKNAPAKGIGADNFVFTYDRLGLRPFSRPRQPHSWELQVLSETGIVGGVFAFGGILLMIVGLLWPRCAAGWKGARQTWLRRSRGEPEIRRESSS